MKVAYSRTMHDSNGQEFTLFKLFEQDCVVVTVNGKRFVLNLSDVETFANTLADVAAFERPN